jgi:hypothetical protein
MSFEERLALLVNRKVHGRQDRRCAKLLKSAKLIPFPNHLCLGAKPQAVH